MRIDWARNPTVNFSRYRTYEWMPAQPRTDPRGPNELLDWRIRTTVETQLAAKGYVRTAEAPDFLLDYVVTRKEKSADTIGDFIKYRESGGEEGPQETFVSGYEEATLALEIFDAGTRQRVWRAAATTANLSPDKQQELATEAVQRMLALFPPDVAAKPAGATPASIP